MGIRFLCPSCGKRINVKEQQAGLRGFCPKCGAGIDVPLESTLPAKNEQEASTMAVAATARANAAAAAAQGVDPLYELPSAIWYALPPGAPKPYGPIDNPGLAQWFYEGRLSPDSMIWRQDWPDWRQVAAVWPNWSPAGANGPGEPMIDPPKDGSSYPLKAVKAESVNRPPVIGARASNPGGSASRGLDKPVAAKLGSAAALGGAVAGGTAVKSALPGTVPVPLGSTAPGAGVYYRRPSNRSYIMTVVVLMLIVVALGGVMVWVLVRTPPPPTPKNKTDGTISTPVPSITPRPIPALDNPMASPTATPPAARSTASGK